MERYAWKATVLPGKLEEYIRRHNEIWPEMKDVLHQAGIRNYTIWNVGNELFGRGGLAGIVAGGLDAAGEGLLRVEADDVVALPAVDGDGHVFQCFQHGFGIDAERGVAFLCKCISVHSCSSLN